MYKVNWLKDFLAAMDSCDPGFSSRIRGASHNRITELEQLCGYKLPEAYKTFLETMGVDDGGANIAFLGTTSIDRLIATYKSMIAENELSFVPKGCILIGTGDASAGDVCLCVDRSEEPAVFLSIDGEIEQRYADSLPQLLFRTVFVPYELCKRPLIWRYESSSNKQTFLASVNAELTRIGFDILWFSDSICLCAKSGDSVVVAEAWDRFAPLLRLGARQRENLDRLDNELSAVGELRLLKRQ